MDDVGRQGERQCSAKWAGEESLLAQKAGRCVFGQLSSAERLLLVAASSRRDALQPCLPRLRLEELWQRVWRSRDGREMDSMWAGTRD